MFRLDVSLGMAKATAFQKKCCCDLAESLQADIEVSEQSTDLTLHLFHSPRPSFSSPAFPLQRNLSDSPWNFSACNFLPCTAQTITSPKNCLLAAKHSWTRQQRPRGWEEKRLTTESTHRRPAKPAHKLLTVMARPRSC